MALLLSSAGEPGGRAIPVLLHSCHPGPRHMDKAALKRAAESSGLSCPLQKACTLTGCEQCRWRRQYQRMLLDFLYADKTAALSSWRAAPECLRRRDALGESASPSAPGRWGDWCRRGCSRCRSAPHTHSEARISGFWAALHQHWCVQYKRHKLKHALCIEACGCV